MAINSPTRARRVSYPYTDGKPMGESDLHVRLMLDLLFTLRWFLSNVRACVAANMFLYYEEGNPKRVVCPDLFVVLGAHPESRMSYQVWNEGGLVPDLVIELTSKSTRKVDQEQKPALYAQLGVQEYILFDPLGHYLRPRLKGFRLKDGAYQPMDDFPIHSERLGLEFRVEDQALRLYDMESGERLPTADEDHLARRSAEVARHLAEVRLTAEAQARRAAENRAAAATARAAEEAARAAEEAARAAEEAARADAAEAELARLREELRRLRGE